MGHAELWFAAAPFPSGTVADDEVIPAVLRVHAKRIGTTRSACGLGTVSWFKYWAPFRVDGPRACENCVDQVTSSQPLGRRFAVASDAG